MSHKVTILWGEVPEPGDQATTYEFATQAELDAFLLGVVNAGGYLNYSYEAEGFTVPTEVNAYEAYHEQRGVAL